MLRLANNKEGLSTELFPVMKCDEMMPDPGLENVILRIKKT